MISCFPSWAAQMRSRSFKLNTWGQRLGVTLKTAKFFLHLDDSLGPRPKTNRSADRLHFPVRYTGSDIHTGWGLGTFRASVLIFSSKHSRKKVCPHLPCTAWATTTVKSLLPSSACTCIIDVSSQVTQQPCCTVLVSFCMISCLPTKLNISLIISLIVLKLFQATACGCAHSSVCYLRRVQRFTLRPIESEDVALQLTPRTVSVTLASAIMAPSVLLLLSEHFSYLNTLRSQRVWISDFLCTVLTLPRLLHYWIDDITGLVAKNTAAPPAPPSGCGCLEQLFLTFPLLVFVSKRTVSIVNSTVKLSELHSRDHCCLQESCWEWWGVGPILQHQVYCHH